LPRSSPRRRELNSAPHGPREPSRRARRSRFARSAVASR
jgi:hypothetical protein